MRDTIHFSGIGGFGMSALAQIAAMEGRKVSGSDRDFDRGRGGAIRAALERLGISIRPQDGSGVDANTSELALSTAIEDSNPEVTKARELGVKISHRSELLAAQVETFDTIVVAGTSGKSTTAAMLFTILEGAGLGPSIITGGALLGLRERGLQGNAYRGKGRLLVVEGDESDGTLTRYKPKAGVLLNITKDHKEVPELRKIFSAFAANCGAFLASADDPEAAALVPGARLFGADAGGWKLEDVRLEPLASRFRLNGTEFFLPTPGRYNVDNAIAACAAASLFGVTPERAAEALKTFRGVDRRFALVGEKGGVKVVDDFAHNPAKLAAALQALRGAASGRVIAVYQPHGFAPARLMRKEFVQVFSTLLGPGDLLMMPEIYFAGGTVAKDISSGDITAEVAAAGRRAVFFPDRSKIPQAAAAEARPGDIIAVMGARDATLSDLAREILAALG
jgi:UDP-N-acetylmuramate--alanine ligase